MMIRKQACPKYPLLPKKKKKKLTTTKIIFVINTKTESDSKKTKQKTYYSFQLANIQ